MKHPTWIGRTLSKRYRIDNMLGQGGMSAVYRATDPNLKRVVAIKLIHEHLSTDPSFVSRFKDEAAAVASLRHPNIVQVYDFNNDGDVYYMVLEFIKGETLQDRMKRLSENGQQLPVEDVLKIFINIADAADYAHQQGMIHRDIKPANIMVDARGQAILMDFGIVKIIGGEKHTSTGAVVGTARYMPPEIVRGEPADHHSDIYSLGVTLFETLSGRPPFVADSAMTLMMMHLNDPVPDVRDFRSGIQPELVTILGKCLAKNREDRYTSAAELSLDLRRVLKDLENKMDTPTIHAFSQKTDSAPLSSPMDSPRISKDKSKERIQDEDATIGAMIPKETISENTGSRKVPEINPVKTKILPNKLLIGIGGIFVIAMASISLRAIGGRQVENTPSPEMTSLPTKAVEIIPTFTQSLKPTLVPTKTLSVKIAYVVGETTHDRAIFVADSTGSNRRNLTSNDCDNAEPDWAPDDSFLVYQSTCLDSLDIWRINPNGSKNEVIMSDPAFDEGEPHFSPSGDKLVYVRRKKGQSYNTNSDIRVYEFGGGDNSTGLLGRGPVYSPDGNRLAFMSFDGAVWQIFIYDFSTKEIQQITFSENDCRWPAWSPDGDYIVFNSATGGGNVPTGIWMVSTDGNKLIPIITDGYYGRPSWSESGWILFNTNDGLWIIHSDGSGRRQLTSDTGQAGVWSK